MMAGPALTSNQPGLDTFIPGHIRDVEKQVAAAKEKGLDVDGARASILDGVRDLRPAFTRGDPALNDPFELYLVDWFLHRVYEELAGPLSDEIAPIPGHPA